MQLSSFKVIKCSSKLYQAYTNYLKYHAQISFVEWKKKYVWVVNHSKNEIRTRKLVQNNPCVKSFVLIAY